MRDLSRGQMASCEIEATDLPPSARATMPADWSESFGAGFLGRVRYMRTFQKPTGLERGDKVWLVVEPPRSLGIVRLGRAASWEPFDGVKPADGSISPSLLADRNTLEIIVDHPALDAANRHAAIQAFDRQGASSAKCGWKLKRRNSHRGHRVQVVATGSAAILSTCSVILL